MRTVLDGILRRMITDGRLTVVWPDGSNTVYQGRNGPGTTVRIRDPRTIRRPVANPSLAAGEEFMSGNMTVEDGSIYDMLDLLMLNLQNNPGGHPVLRLRRFGFNRPPIPAVQPSRPGAPQRSPPL